MLVQSLLVSIVSLAGAAGAAPVERSTAPAVDLRFFEGTRRKPLPAKVTALDSEGVRHLNEGSYDEAVAAFDRSLKLQRGNPRALSNRGLALLQLGRLEEAIHDLEASAAELPSLRLALAPSLAEARLRRGRLRFDGGDVKGALDDLYAAVRADRKHWQAYSEIALAAQRTGQFETCLKYAARAAALNPESPEPHAHRGACHAAQGKKAEALKDLDRAIRLDARRGDFYARRAELHRDSGRCPQARADAKRAEELDSHLRDGLESVIRGCSTAPRR